MYKQLEFDLGLPRINDVLTDRQTDRQTAADAGGENRQGKEGSDSCG